MTSEELMVLIKLLMPRVVEQARNGVHGTAEARLLAKMVAMQKEQNGQQGQGSVHAALHLTVLPIGL